MKVMTPPTSIACANHATVRRHFENRKGVDCRWFHYLDVMTAHGPRLLLRDAVRIGKKLGIEIFKQIEMSPPWKTPVYENQHGNLRLEKFPKFGTDWYRSEHETILKDLTHYYLFDNVSEGLGTTTPSPLTLARVPLTASAYNLALHFLSTSEVTRVNNRKGSQRPVGFHSRWYDNAEHISGLKRAEALDALQLLTGNGVIESVSKTSSYYRFTHEFEF